MLIRQNPFTLLTRRIAKTAGSWRCTTSHSWKSPGWTVCRWCKGKTPLARRDARRRTRGTPEQLTRSSTTQPVRRAASVLRSINWLQNVSNVSHRSSVMVDHRCCDTASFVRSGFESQYATWLVGIKQHDRASSWEMLLTDSLSLKTRLLAALLKGVTAPV